MEYYGPTHALSDFCQAFPTTLATEVCVRTAPCPRPQLTTNVLSGKKSDLPGAQLLWGKKISQVPCLLWVLVSHLYSDR